MERTEEKDIRNETGDGEVNEINQEDRAVKAEPASKTSQMIDETERTEEKDIHDETGDGEVNEIDQEDRAVKAESASKTSQMNDEMERTEEKDIHDETGDGEVNEIDQEDRAVKAEPASKTSQMNDEMERTEEKDIHDETGDGEVNEIDQEDRAVKAKHASKTNQMIDETGDGEVNEINQEDRAVKAEPASKTSQMNDEMERTEEKDIHDETGDGEVNEIDQEDRAVKAEPASKTSQMIDEMERTEEKDIHDETGDGEVNEIDQEDRAVKAEPASKTSQMIDEMERIEEKVINHDHGWGKENGQNQEELHQEEQTVKKETDSKKKQNNDGMEPKVAQSELNDNAEPTRSKRVTIPFSVVCKIDQFVQSPLFGSTTKHTFKFIDRNEKITPSFNTQFFKTFTRYTNEPYCELVSSTVQEIVFIEEAPLPNEKKSNQLCKIYCLPLFESSIHEEVSNDLTNFTLKIPVVNGEYKLEVCLEEDIQLEEKVFLIKEVSSEAGFKTCKFIPTRFSLLENGRQKVLEGELFLEGFVQQNIEYSIVPHKDKENKNQLRQKIVVEFIIELLQVQKVQI
ncbi:hypothetical protein K6959_02345 [Bacillus aquiflavi]|uniref:BC_2427 family protein n=1 Tax=Bacillus aquiflavi TaxID=2672567 RepID=UPI001CA8BFEF|nr:hypothetical protein [Bacillus aquiflavi]UAC48817.1 hypothetical protein K6959_02345 [Bacillus aquiflavi]